MSRSSPEQLQIESVLTKLYIDYMAQIVSNAALNGVQMLLHEYC